jgi:hypothetical protein
MVSRTVVYLGFIFWVGKTTFRVGKIKFRVGGAQPAYLVDASLFPQLGYLRKKNSYQTQLI